MKTIQSGTMISENGRDGKIEADDQSFTVDFGASHDGITPEHLFAGAYAACFHSALKSAAEKAHQDITGSTVIVSARLNEQGERGSTLALELRVSLPGMSARDAGHLMHQAHSSCPYSKAVRGNVTVHLGLD